MAEPSWGVRLRHEVACNGACWVFGTILVVQIAHFAEHVTQVHQHFLGVHKPMGLLGAHLDFVWVHAAYNLAVWAAIVGTYALWRRDPGGWRSGGMGGRIFAFLVVFQTYHAVEHVFQVWQYYQDGLAAPPGLIGQYVPNIVAHFDLNLVLTLLMLTVWFTLRPRRLPMPGGAGRPAGAPA